MLLTGRTQDLALDFKGFGFGGFGLQAVAGRVVRPACQASRVD